MKTKDRIKRAIKKTKKLSDAWFGEETANSEDLPSVRNRRDLFMKRSYNFSKAEVIKGHIKSRSQVDKALKVPPMPSLKTINICLPVDLVKKIQKAAKADQVTVCDLIGEALRQYQAQRNLKVLALKGRKAAKKKKITPKNLGGTFKAPRLSKD